MDKPKPIFPLNSRVRLKDNVDPEFYNGYSRVGNEGWVKDRKVDNMGYPLILIEWDKDHWSYNGAPDKWTWEPHFELIEENMSESKEDVVSEAITNLVNAIRAEQAPDRDTPAKGGPEAHEEQADDSEYGDIESFKRNLAEAVRVLQKSRAYVLVAIEEADDQAHHMVYPYMFEDAISEDLSLICQSQLSQLCAALHSKLVAGVLEHHVPDNEA